MTVTTRTPTTSPESSNRAFATTPDASAWEPRASWQTSILIACGLATALVAVGYAMHGRSLAEKTMIALVMPLGGVWLIASGRLLHVLVRGRIGKNKMLLGLWLLIFIGGTRPLNDVLTRALETSVVTYNPERDPDLDVVIVLGGGTSSGPWRSQAAASGDRLVLAAQLYHQRHASHLVTTGEATAGVSKMMIDPSEQTIEIWTGLGIPRHAISQLGGRNTSEELAEVKEAWSRFEGKRVGLLTSAIHLPRAMRLARSHNLPLIPIAAEVKWMPASWSLLDFIPQASNFSTLVSLQHEAMAFLIKR